MQVPPRYVLYPIQETAMWNLYKAAEARFWTAEDHWHGNEEKPHSRVPADELGRLLSNIITFHTAPILNRLAADIPALEGKAFLNYQAAMRNIHSETYVLMLEKHSTTASKPASDNVEALILAAENLSINRRREEWVHQAALDEKDLSKRLVGIACAEAIIFRSFSVAVASADEALSPVNMKSAVNKIHGDKMLTLDFLLLLYQYESNRRPADHAVIIREAAELEIASLHGMIPD
ncbi:ribonucleotide reductase small subunit [Mycena vulgaris]|nr:ribonucleotide reductase small subunit [Mycena vulgaris]